MMKCGASVRRNGKREQCGLPPSAHGIELQRAAVSVAHAFVLTDSK